MLLLNVFQSLDQLILPGPNPQSHLKSACCQFNEACNSVFTIFIKFCNYK